VADLILLPDIGPEGTRPHVTYAQAASFTGFLAQRFGFQALRKAIASLSPVASAEDNETAFAQAFGVSSEDAAGLWLARLDEICPERSLRLRPGNEALHLTARFAPRR
jgi:hypothetical protein